MTSAPRRLLAATAVAVVGITATAHEVLPAGATAAAPVTRQVLSQQGNLVRHANGVTTPVGFGSSTFTQGNGSASLSKPDDITTLNGVIYVTFQNGVNPDGTVGTNGATQSTIAGFDSAGRRVATWMVTGRCDGLTADPANGRLIATINEDANTRMAILRPGTPTPIMLTLSGTAGVVTGGLDAVTILNPGPAEHYFVSTSNPAPAGTANVLAEVVINEGAATATFTAVLAGNAPATDLNTSDNPLVTALNMTDPDSNTVIPVGPNAGKLLLVGEGDKQLALVTNPNGIGGTQSVGVLNVASGPGDIAFPTAPFGTLYVTDTTTGKVQAITGSWTVGQPILASPIKSGAAAQAGGFVGTLDLATGNEVPLFTGFTAPAGLLFIPGTPQQGYWEAAGDGGIFPFGNAVGYGSTGNLKLNQPIVGIASTSDGGGYWMVASDGGIFPFGNAVGYGSTGNLKLNKPIVGIAALPDSSGYWLCASDGGIFPFGSAVGYGSLGNVTLNKPIVGCVSTTTGKGFWQVASDGGIFPFGDATGIGSLGGRTLGAPIVGMAATPDGTGYWLVGSDGTVYPFGSARNLGGTSGIKLAAPIVGISATKTGNGYWLVAGDGGIFPFGDAQGIGSVAGVKLNKPVVGIAGVQ